MHKTIDSAVIILNETSNKPNADSSKEDSLVTIKKRKIKPAQPAWVRVIRASQAHCYLGMNRHRFNALVRPELICIPLGKKACVYDRLDLDAWFEDYKHRNGRPTGELTQRGNKPWDEKKHPDSLSVRESGTLINKYKGDAFAKVQARIRSKKRSAT